MVYGLVYGLTLVTAYVLLHFMLKLLGFYFHNKYMCNVTSNSNCALQGHQCDSLVVLELGEYKTGLTGS